MPESQQARTWAMFCHLSSLVWIVLGVIGLPIPLSNLLGPLVVWLLKKDQYRFVDAHGRESLNFQISMTLYGIALFILAIAAFFVYLIIAGTLATLDGGAFAVIGGVMGGIGLVILLSLIGLVELVLVIVAAIQAQKGNIYRYPLTLRFL